MNSRDHWKKIADAEKKRADKKIEQLAKEIEETFNRAVKNIDTEMASWYAKYAEENGLTMQAARKALNEADLKEFRMTLEEYIQHGKELDIDKSWLSAMKSASERHHIDRFTALKIETQAELTEAMAKWSAAARKRLDELVTDHFLHKHYDIAHDVGVGKYINGADIRKLKIAANKAWSPDGMEFKDRPGINNAKLVQTVQRELSNACITGSSYEDMARRVNQAVGVGMANAKRIIKTEATHLCTLADRETYHDLGVTKYQYIASLDNKTCDICAEQDLYVDDVSNMQEGVNAPPMHPNCRCITVPYYDDNFGTRAARNRDGKTIFVPETMGYKEWKEKYVNEAE